MVHIKIDERLCKACRLCISICKNNVIQLNTRKTNEKGYYTAYAAAPENCTCCTFCALMCPDCAISIER